MLDDRLRIYLKHRFNPDGSMLRRHQLRMLEMLVYFDKVCKENDIKYWLSSGTLLGAVRHGGFIPWDDDLDVAMLREDYEKLEKVWDDADFFLQTYKTDPFYVVPYAKMRDKASVIKEHSQDANYKYHGIYIDIFVMEPGSRFVAKIMGVLSWEILVLGSKSRSWMSKQFFFVLKRLVHFVATVFRYTLHAFLNKNVLRYSYGSGFSDEEALRERVLPLGEISFEDHSFSAPRNPDDCLRRVYGDYMQLPELDNLQPHLSDIKFL